MINYLLPGIIIYVLLISLIEKKNTYKLFCSGVLEGIQSLFHIFPTLFSIFIIISLFKNLPFIETSSSKIILFLLLIFTRAFSQSAAMSILFIIFNKYGVDSNISMISSIILAGSETTFYVISTYFGVTNYKISKKVIISGIVADIVLIGMTVLTFKSFI